MKKRITIHLFLTIMIAFISLSLAQFTPEEVAEWSKWEEFLLNAEITSERQLSGREAVTSPWVITLEKDGVQRQAVWKNPQGRQKGFLEGWNWEIAAYRIDKLLGLNMVPPTVEKRLHGSRGSCQLWIEHEMTLRDKEQNKVKTPSYKIFYWNRALYLQRFFDNLIANEDRHQNNYLITKDWRIILIDHSRSFRTSGKFTKNLIYTEKYKEGPMVMRELPRALVDKLKTLTFESIKEAVGEYLNDDEINAIMQRKVLILEEIDKLIKKHGEETVLY